MAMRGSWQPYKLVRLFVRARAQASLSGSAHALASFPALLFHLALSLLASFLCAESSHASLSPWPTDYEKKHTHTNPSISISTRAARFCPITCICADPPMASAASGRVGGGGCERRRQSPSKVGTSREGETNRPECACVIATEARKCSPALNHLPPMCFRFRPANPAIVCLCECFLFCRLVRARSHLSWLWERAVRETLASKAPNLAHLAKLNSRLCSLVTLV